MLTLQPTLFFLTFINGLECIPRQFGPNRRNARVSSILRLHHNRRSCSIVWGIIAFSFHFPTFAPGLGPTLVQHSQVQE